MRYLRGIALSVGLWLAASVALAAPGNRTFLVLGVIASAEPDQGVALLKGMQGGEAFAVRAGQKIDDGVVIESITRDYVYLNSRGQREKVRVGEQLDSATPVAPAPGPVLDARGTGIEREGNTVRISASLREHVLKNQLGTVLMQAAAVPYFVDGELKGFRLWDIDQGSLYEKAGFANGDIITAINGQRLTDVGMTIRVLQALKDDTKADVTYIRQGAERQVSIVIQ